MAVRPVCRGRPSPKDQVTQLSCTPELSKVGEMTGIFFVELPYQYVSDVFGTTRTRSRR